VQGVAERETVTKFVQREMIKKCGAKEREKNALRKVFGGGRAKKKVSGWKREKKGKRGQRNACLVQPWKYMLRGGTHARDPSGKKKKKRKKEKRTLKQTRKRDMPFLNCFGGKGD